MGSDGTDYVSLFVTRDKIFRCQIVVLVKLHPVHHVNIAPAFLLDDLAITQAVLLGDEVAGEIVNSRYAHTVNLHPRALLSE